MTIATPVRPTKAYADGYRRGGLARYSGALLEAAPTGATAAGLPDDLQRGWRAGWTNADLEIRRHAQTMASPIGVPAEPKAPRYTADAIGNIARDGVVAWAATYPLGGILSIDEMARRAARIADLLNQHGEG